MEHLINAVTLTCRELTRSYIYRSLGTSVIILDLSNIQDISANIRNLGILRILSPHTKIILLKTTLLNHKFLNRFHTWDIDSSLTTFDRMVIENLEHTNKLTSNSEISIKAFTQAQVDFLYLYSQGLSMPDIAAKLSIPIKTAFSRKNLLWRRMEIEREINISYILPNIKNHLQTRHAKELDWCHYHEKVE